MARTLGSAAPEVAKKLGTEPIFIIEVDWGDDVGIKAYADRDFDGVDGKILSIGGLDAVLKLGATGSTASLSVILDDSDESIKAILNTVDVQKRPCYVYQTYGALAESDKFLLFNGELNSPLQWSERDRTFRFEVVTNIEDREIGFSPEEGEFEFISDSAVGKAWPLCFGRPIRVPAVKLTERIRGTSLTRYGAISVGDLNSLCDAAQAVADAESAKTAADDNPGFSDENYEALIDALNDAQISLNTTKEALIFDSPTQETQIESYIETCKDLQLAETLQAFLTQNALTSQSEIAALNAAIISLEDQILTAQGADPPDLALIASLAASLAAAQSDLSSASATQASIILQLGIVNDEIDSLEAAKEILEYDLTQIVITEIVVDQGEKFPQATPLHIIVNGLRYYGSFSGNVFTINSVVPTLTNIPFAERQNDNANEFWIEDAGINLRKQYCFIPGYGIVFVDSQQGTRCQFTPLLFRFIGSLGELFNILVNGEPVDREVYEEVLLSPVFGGEIQATSVIIFHSWIESVRAVLPDFASGLSKASTFDYGIEIGDDVYLDEDYQDLYIANLIPSTEIKEVIGKRVINGVEQFLPVPSSRYIIDLNEEIAGQNATTIRFLRPLSQYIDENWGDDIYVTLVSSEGPNTSDVLKYLIETYTDLVVDTTSFDAVKTAITLYPSDFALLERSDALTTIEDIAWQARCAVIIKNGIAYLKYLAAVEAELFTLTEDDIDNLSVKLSNSDDIVTKFIAIWKRDLSLDEDDKVILRNNVPKYGLIEEEYNFYIYNIKELVLKSATFWLIRLSNTWKIAEFTAFLDTLEAESFDTLELDFADSIIADSAIKGIVQKAEYNSSQHEITYEVWTAVLSGDIEEHPLFWPASAPGGTEYPTEKDPFAGGG